MVEKYNPETDYAEVSSWFKAHGQNSPQPEDLPPTGLIEHGVAAGFLIVSDVKVGWLEYYISNPQSNAHYRGKALDEITQGLIELGKKRGLRYFKADTTLVVVGQRAMRNGFEFMGKHSVYFRKG